MAVGFLPCVPSKTEPDQRTTIHGKKANYDLTPSVICDIFILTPQERVNMGKSKYPMSPKTLAAEATGVTPDEIVYGGDPISQVYSFLYRRFPESAPRATGSKRFEITKEMRDAYIGWSKDRAEKASVAA